MQVVPGDVQFRYTAYSSHERNLNVLQFEVEIMIITKKICEKTKMSFDGE